MLPALALRSLSDQALLARLDELVRSERESLADIVEHLVEAERRETALDVGYGSLFEYCVKKLGYSEAAAFLRIRAARACARFPEVLGRLRSGSIHLDAIARLYPHLTCDNSGKLLDKAAGASKRDVLALVATLQAEPAPVKDVIVAVPPPIHRGRRALLHGGEVAGIAQAQAPGREAGRHLQGGLADAS